MIDKKRTFAKRQWYRCQGQEASGRWSLEVSLAAQVQVAPLCLAHHPFLWSPPPSLLSPPLLLLPADSAFLLAPQSHLEAALKPGWAKTNDFFGLASVSGNNYKHASGQLVGPSMINLESLCLVFGACSQEMAGIVVDKNVVKHEVDQQVVVMTKKVVDQTAMMVVDNT